MQAFLGVPSEIFSVHCEKFYVAG